MLDDEMLKGLAQSALRQALETISNQLMLLAEDPQMKLLNGQEALIAASQAILSNNAQQWGAIQ